MILDDIGSPKWSYIDILPDNSEFTPKNGWLEYYVPIGGGHVSFREGIDQ